MKNDNITFNVTKQFSRTPSARIAKEGKYPGSELRNIITPLIKKAIKEKGTFTIILDGAAGYGTSFLEEVFGGLVRIEHIPYQDLVRTLNIVSDEEPELIEEIWDDIKEAAEI